MRMLRAYTHAFKNRVALFKAERRTSSAQLRMQATSALRSRTSQNIVTSNYAASSSRNGPSLKDYSLTVDIGLPKLLRWFVCRHIKRHNIIAQKNCEVSGRILSYWLRYFVIPSIKSYFGQKTFGK